MVRREPHGFGELGDADHPGGGCDVCSPQAVCDDAWRDLHPRRGGQVTVFKSLFALIADHVWSTSFDLKTAADLEMARNRGCKVAMEWTIDACK